MKFDPDHKIWLCASHDEARPVLTYCLVQRTGPETGTITAADGFVLAVISCTLTPEEEVGLVHWTALDAAAKRQKSQAWKRAHDGQIVLELKGDQVQLLGMSILRWQEPDHATGMNYPDVTQIVTKTYLAMPRRSTKDWCFNPKRLAQMASALGKEHLQLFCSDGSDLYTCVRDTDDEGNPKAPYGALMGGNLGK